MEQLVLIIHVFAAISIVALVLLQQGKGSDVGATFGAGSANTMFGSQGSLPFFMKLTAAAAITFFLTSLYLAHLANQRVNLSQAATLPVSAPAKSPASNLPSLPLQGLPLNKTLKPGSVKSPSTTAVQNRKSKVDNVVVNNDKFKGKK